MASAKDIRDKIIEILKAADPKNSAGKSIKKWLQGQPPSGRYPNFPFSWTQWLGGPVKPSTMDAKATIVDRYYIVVLDKHLDEKKAENSILSFEESFDAALKPHPTLGGLVEDSYIENREAAKTFPFEGVQEDYSMAGLCMTLFTRRRGRG